MSVPSAVAITVDTAAISSEVLSASPTPCTAKGCFQASRLNSCQMKLKRPVGLLKEKTMMTAIGSRR